MMIAMMNRIKRNAKFMLTMILVASASTPILAQALKGVVKGASASSRAAKVAAATLQGIQTKQKINRATPKPPAIAPAPKLNTPVPALPRNNAKLVKAPIKGKKKNKERPKRSK